MITTSGGIAFSGDRAFLSNFHPSELSWDGHDWPDVETAFAAAKTLDSGERDWVAAAGHPGEAKRRGRRVTLRDGWDDTVRDTVMAELLACKFQAGSELADRLMQTGTDLLVEENTWGDRYWGQVNGQGTNKLGRLLMARRAILACEHGPVIDERLDLWDLWQSGAWAVIPTNEQTRNDGAAVMGAGVAKAAVEHAPGLAARYGNALKQGHSHMAYPTWRMLCVATKHHWRDNADPTLVATGAGKLADWCANNLDDTIAVPALGAGLGGLDQDWVADTLRTALAGRRAILLPPR
jgi:ribA/ribD-fused uncharacterized protein